MLKTAFKYFEGFIDIRPHELSLPPQAGSFRALLAFLYPFRWLISASFLTGVLLTGFELLKLWSVAYLVDAVAHSQNLSLSRENLKFFGILIVAYLLLDPAIWLLNYMLRMQSLRSQIKSSSLWQSHKAASRHDLSYFHGNHAGQIAGRINQVSLAVQNGAELLAGRFPIGLVRFIGSTLLVAYLAPLFIVPVLIWLVLNGLFAVWLAPKVNIQARKIAETSSLVNGAVTEYYSNIRAIKTSFAHKIEDDYVYSAIDRQNENSLQISRLTTLTGLLIRILNTGLVAAILGVGIYGLSIQAVTPGQFVAGVTLAGGMAADAGWFVSIWEGLTQTLGTIKDARSTIEANPEITSPATSNNATVRRPPRIEIHDVSFSYFENRPVLKNLNLIIEPGEKVGIVGVSGTGKSTLIDLLLRLYDVKRGEIRLDGVNIKDLSISDLRAVFSVVSQDDALFHRSIRDNIAFGVENSSIEDVVSAAHKANADTFIEKHDPFNRAAGYDQVVGDRGAKLSGGQQQRILLARAFMQKRPVLILDEATSALDSASEQLVQDALKAYSSETTIIAIAHRLSTLTSFDKIAVMADGSISDVGTHAELLGRNFLYRQLWERQRTVGADTTGPQELSRRP